MLYYLTASSLDIIFIVSSLIKKDAWFGFCFSLSLHFYCFFFLVRFAEFPNWQNEETARFHFDEHTLMHTHTHAYTRTHTHNHTVCNPLEVQASKTNFGLCVCTCVFCCWILLNKTKSGHFVHSYQPTNLYKAANFTFAYDFGYSYPFHCVDKCIWHRYNWNC